MKFFQVFLIIVLVVFSFFAGLFVYKYDKEKREAVYDLSSERNLRMLSEEKSGKLESKVDQLSSRVKYLLSNLKGLEGHLNMLIDENTDLKGTIDKNDTMRMEMEQTIQNMKDRLEDLR